MFEDNNNVSSSAPYHRTDGGQNQPHQDTSAMASSVSPKGGAVEDIFADTDSGKAPQVPPAGQAPVPGPPTALTSGKLKPTAPRDSSVPLSQISGKSAKFPLKKIIIIATVSLGVIVIAGALYFVWNSASSAPPEIPALGQPESARPAETAPTTAATPSTPEPESDLGVNNTDALKDARGGFLDNFQQSQIDKALNPIPEDLASIDTDQDGLSDAQEFKEGTNPRLVDSDNDGLSDWEEIAIFGTDPLNIDSDGDTYMDGEEVQNGYDPLGPGKLLNFEQNNKKVK